MGPRLCLCNRVGKGVEGKARLFQRVHERWKGGCELDAGAGRMDCKGGRSCCGKGVGCLWRLEGIRAKVTDRPGMFPKLLGPASTAGD